MSSQVDVPTEGAGSLSSSVTGSAYVDPVGVAVGPVLGEPDATEVAGPDTAGFGGPGAEALAACGDGCGDGPGDPPGVSGR
ncbi:hypothetical protein BDK92_6370 [Micromonospora pisi]|uniref:Uncharacterized protein n=1 Tax=Micromonospora pisi TaxID=589240 RepID=A0A495JUX8_9ACTN|nr:hypothetical protein [Micromonospora pisi]RKR91939.1 hypothetical protein BDK92_6370 [Micromonospora pisi]